MSFVLEQLFACFAASFLIQFNVFREKENEKKT